jgi:prepilin-type N-terminal cleavage/methylation domain-containing protein
MARASHRGFSLIELMVALVIAALLVTLAVPSYTLWIADAQIRAAAESVGSGLRYAQGEAVKRNSQVEFILDPTTGTGGWRARLVADGSILERAYFAEGAPRTTLTTLSTGGGPGSTTVTFTGLGGIAPANADASPVLAEVRITTSTGIAGTRNLNVLVGGGASGVAGQATRTGIKICDPKWPATDPKGCPA